MKIRKLNTLRGIAALIVVVSHYSNETNFLNGILGHGGGQLGVMIFFILSGFLMSYLYMNKEFNITEVKQFAFARIARVVPLFLIIVLSSYLLISLDIKGILYDIPNVAILISHLTFLSATSLLWTIPAEIQFYIFFILLWWLLHKVAGHLYIIMAMLFIAIMYLKSPVQRGNVFGIPYEIVFISALPYFLMGVVYGQLYSRWRPPNYLTSGIFVLSILLIFLMYPNIFRSIFGLNHGMWRDIRVLLTVSLVFFLLVFLVPENNIFLSNRIGDFLGNISYSLYLLHLPILLQFPKLDKDHPAIFLVIFLITSISISYLSYLILETPCRKAIRSVASRKTAILTPPH